MKKIVFLLIAIIFVAVNTQAKTLIKKEKIANTKKNEISNSNMNLNSNISGTVVDSETGESLVGVALYIEEINKTVYTDFEGNFKVSNIAEGEYNIKSNYISYNNNSLRKVNVKANNNTIKMVLKKNK